MTWLMKHRQEYLVKNIIITGTEPDGKTPVEADFLLIDKNNVELYCESRYFLEHAGILNYHKFLNKKLFAAPTLNFQKLQKINPQPPSFNLIKGKGYYSFVGKIKSIDFGNQHPNNQRIPFADIVAFCGTTIIIQIGPVSLKLGFKNGDYFTAEGAITLFEEEFLEDASNKWRGINK